MKITSVHGKVRLEAVCSSTGRTLILSSSASWVTEPNQNSWFGPGPKEGASAPIEMRTKTGAQKAGCRVVTGNLAFPAAGPAATGPPPLCCDEWHPGPEATFAPDRAPHPAPHARSCPLLLPVPPRAPQTLPTCSAGTKPHRGRFLLPPVPGSTRSPCTALPPGLFTNKPDVSGSQTASWRPRADLALARGRFAAGSLGPVSSSLPRLPRSC